jgi:hypothetical protein
MSDIVLSIKATKLITLCDAHGFENFDGLLHACTQSTTCPAICMTEGCDFTTEVEPNQDQGLCEACGGNTVTSARMLAGIGDAAKRRVRS